MEDNAFMKAHSSVPLRWANHLIERWRFCKPLRVFGSTAQCDGTSSQSIVPYMARSAHVPGLQGCTQKRDRGTGRAKYGEGELEARSI